MPPVVEESGPSQERGACGRKKQEKAKRFAAFVKGSGAFVEARGLRLEEAKGGKRFAAFVEENGPSQKRGACGWKK